MTDIHLDSANKEAIENLSEECRGSDVIFITGDISNATYMNFKLEDSLKIITDKPIYFIFGNHDYYGGTFSGVREFIRELCSKTSQLNYLQQENVIKLNEETALIGGDSWYDLGFGNFFQSKARLNDFYLIQDLSPFKNEYLYNRIVDFAKSETEKIEQKLKNALDDKSIKTIYCLTHVPPYAECHYYNGKISTGEYSPFFACKMLGEMFDKVMLDRPDVQLISLSGHTHHEANYSRASNITAKVGRSEYGRPQVAEFIEI